MRKVAFGLIILLAVLAGGWTAAWFYAARETGDQLEAWLKAEAAAGRHWTCPERAVGGYPFALTVACAKPSFTGQALDQTVEVRVAGLVASTAIYAPHSVSVLLSAPLTYRTSDGKADLKATWSRLGLRIDGLPNVEAVALNGTDIAVDGTFGQMGHQGGRADQLITSFAVERETNEPTLTFAIDVKGTPLPDVDAILGGQTPADITLNGRLEKIEAAAGRTPAEVIERWRQAGGSMTLANSRIGRGESSVTGSGSLVLDDAHCPQGRIDASFVGLEPVLRRFGISGNVAAAGNLLSSLFGGAPKQPQQADPNALNLPITLKGGRLGVGPIRTQIAVPPIY